MIEIHCFTNLDLTCEAWPKELPAVPRVGDNIQSATCHSTSRYGTFQLHLKVVGVTWKRAWDNGQKWYPEVELHDYRDRSIREFYEWYAPKVGHNVSYFI